MPPPNSAVIATGVQAATKIGIWLDAPKAFKKLDKKKRINPIPTPIAMSLKLFWERGGRSVTHAAISVSAAKNRGRAKSD